MIDKAGFWVVALLRWMWLRTSALGSLSLRFGKRWVWQSFFPFLAVAPFARACLNQSFGRSDKKRRGGEKRLWKSQKEVLQTEKKLEEICSLQFYIAAWTVFVLPSNGPYTDRSASKQLPIREWLARKEKWRLMTVISPLLSLALGGQKIIFLLNNDAPLLGNLGPCH